MKDCLFCKIIKGEISANKVYEDEEILDFGYTKEAYYFISTYGKRR